MSLIGKTAKFEVYNGRVVDGTILEKYIGSGSLFDNVTISVEFYIVQTATETIHIECSKLIKVV